MEKQSLTSGFAPILLLVYGTFTILTAFVGILGYKEYKLKKSILGTPTPIPLPTIAVTPAPTNIPDTNPIIDCSISKECGGGSKRLKLSVCNNMICCLYDTKCGGAQFVTKTKCNTDYSCFFNDGTCKVLASKSACDNYYTNNPQAIQKTTTTTTNNYPPCTIYYSSLGYSQTYQNISPSQCQVWKDESVANTIVTNKSTQAPAPAPTTSPEQDQAAIEALAKAIQACWDSVNATYNQRVHNCQVQFGGTSAAQACADIENKNRQHDLNACEGR